jgi:hypothetical protein
MAALVDHNRQQSKPFPPETVLKHSGRASRCGDHHIDKLRSAHDFSDNVDPQQLIAVASAPRLWTALEADEEGDDFAHGLFLQSSSFTGSPLPLPLGLRKGSMNIPSCCGNFGSSLVSPGRP